MAYQVGSTCYGSAAEALSAIASAQVGALVQHGGAAYIVDVESVTASSIVYALHPVAGGASLTQTIALTPQPCRLLEWSDGLVIGWGIAAAWIATACVVSLRRAVHGV